VGTCLDGGREVGIGHLAARLVSRVLLCRVFNDLPLVALHAVPDVHLTIFTVSFATIEMPRQSLARTPARHSSVAAWRT